MPFGREDPLKPKFEERSTPMGEKIKLFLTDAVRRVDWVLLLCTTVLSVISLVTVYGAVDNFGMS